MKIFLSLLLILVVSTNVKATNGSERSELLMMLKERKELFDIYNQSLDKKSGFFGNTSKKDLRDSQEKLLDVIEADNKIMSSLSRTLEFRNFEKQTLSYDVSGYENRIRNISVLNDTLNKQYLNCVKENKALLSRIKRSNLYLVSLITLFLVATVIWIRKRFS